MVALDGGEPPRSGTLVVDVNVRDSNDNSPQFPGNATFIATVNENVPVGTVIATLNAADHDTGYNAEISYQLSPETARDFGRMFGVRPRTGELFTRAALDYETRSEYVLYVTATDRTGTGNDAMVDEGSLTSQALVIVRVQDVNDNAPRIDVHVLSSTMSSSSGPVARLHDVQRHDAWHLEVSEGVPEGTLVAHVTVQDADSGDNGQFRCAVIDTEGFTLRPLAPYPAEFKLVTLATLDRELAERHRFAVVCRDSPVNPDAVLTSTAFIEVTVVDRNDHAPVFEHPVYYLTVAENSPVGTSLLQVSAVDRDSGPNGVISYRLQSAESEPDAHNLVGIDSKSGVISAKVGFDRESLPRVIFDVVATDSGADTPRTGRTRVHLSIADVDDQLPVFALPVYSFVVDENRPPGTGVGHVSAIDRDLDPFNKFTYASIRYLNSSSSCLTATGSRKPPPFRLDPITGAITTTESLDREQCAVYEVTLRATVSPRLSNSANTIKYKGEHGAIAAGSGASCNAVIYVSDVNDNRPTFDFPQIGNDHVVHNISRTHTHTHTHCLSCCVVLLA